MNVKKIINKIQYRYNINIESFQIELYNKKRLQKNIKNNINIFKNELSTKKRKVKSKTIFSDLYILEFPISKGKKSLKIKNNSGYKNYRKGKSKRLARYNQFNTNNLPLIGVAKFLKIEVEKAFIFNGAYAFYSNNKRKIVMGSDYAPFFIHELAHAIDHIIPDQKNNYHFNEIVAETVSILLCRKYRIPYDMKFSLDYLRYHASECSYLATGEIMKRVTQIIVFIIEINRIKNNGA